MHYMHLAFLNSDAGYFQAVEVKEALEQLCLTGDPDTLSTILLNDGQTNYRELKSEVSNINDKQKCPHCGKIIVKKRNMQRHISAKHAAGEFKCSECVFISKDKVQLRKHSLSMHTKSSYVCPQCDQRCKTKNSLDCHRRAKHEDLKPSCGILR